MTARTPQTIDVASLPASYPTHRHDPAFWEALGRVVATFGFLEEILGKAIFAFTATRPYSNMVEAEQAYAAWLPQLERALTDPLGNLIDVYGRAVREHPEAGITDFDDLLTDLRKASDIRNVLCHGSWPPPDVNGASVPLFVTRRKEIFETAVDQSFLAQVQRATAELACAVMSTVTVMGWRFPGSSGPGAPIDLAGAST
jgi:hypothetical protein